MSAPNELRPWYRRISGSRPARELTFFVGAAVLALVAVAAGTVLISQQIARSNALDEVERTTMRLADLLLGPLVPGYLDGTADQRREFEMAVAAGLRDPSILSVLVWDDGGRILYSSRPGEEGHRSAVSEELGRALAGTLVAVVDDAPEAAYGGGLAGPVLEVYAPLTAGDSPLALEVYYDYAVIDQEAARLRGQILPMALGGLALLQAVQFPIAASLARRVRRNDDERAAVADAALLASERERRSIAADLHDGPVQDLAGVSYALSALRGSVPEGKQAMVDRLATVVRTAVVGLRRVMLAVYPPDLSADGLPRALDDLALPLQERGLTVEVRTEPLPPLGPQQAATLYRTAKEALSNVAHHAEASHVWVALELDGSTRRPAVRLQVSDDGVGFPPDRRDDTGGHLGLQLICDRLGVLGGEMELADRPGGGTVVTVRLPVDREV